MDAETRKFLEALMRRDGVCKPNRLGLVASRRVIRIVLGSQRSARGWLNLTGVGTSPKLAAKHSRRSIHKAT